MTVEAQVTVNGTLESVWAVMADIENSAQILTGVEKIELLERPPNGIRGLKWRETRMLLGKPGTVEKVVIAGAENEFFSTESKEGGFIFLTTNLIREREHGILLRSTHQTIPQGFIATIKALPMIFFKGVIKKVILQDLNDIKAAVEPRYWYPFEAGKSIGQRGAENGITMRDDEHGDGARITLERDGGIAPFSITCGIYGWFFHTRFFGAESDAQHEFDSMKTELARIIGTIPLARDPEADLKASTVTTAISKFVKRFP